MEMMQRHLARSLSSTSAPPPPPPPPVAFHHFISRDNNLTVDESYLHPSLMIFRLS
jgi:hypothetical protein